MREILFRGKRVDNGEWVEGGITFDMSGTPYICPTRFLDYNEEIEVIPETVGEYTGLTDKNGNKIFEGDIVVINADNNIGNINGYMGIVVYHDCSYELQNIEDKDCYECLWYDNDELEVRGNIYDNPELLEAK